MKWSNEFSHSLNPFGAGSNVARKKSCRLSLSHSLCLMIYFLSFSFFFSVQKRILPAQPMCHSRARKILFIQASNAEQNSYPCTHEKQQQNKNETSDQLQKV
jgi:hypothetical protein